DYFCSAWDSSLSGPLF
nr:immunoglobulin light chain junction region [Macaca mulatta]MOX32684.1 immunoglobulin light chain junction region [Macaca mulatta]